MKRYNVKATRLKDTREFRQAKRLGKKQIDKATVWRFDADLVWQEDERKQQKKKKIM